MIRHVFTVRENNQGVLSTLDEDLALAVAQAIHPYSEHPEWAVESTPLVDSAYVYEGRPNVKQLYQEAGKHAH